MRRIVIFLAVFIFFAILSCTEKSETSIVSGPVTKIESDTGLAKETEDKTAVAQDTPSMEEKPVSGDVAAVSESGGTKTTAETTRRAAPKGSDGVIGFVEGDVKVSRDGSYLPSVKEGVGIENYDLVRTGTASETEIEVVSTRAPHAIISVSENTCFTFEINSLESKDSTTLDMLTGTVGLKVAALAGRQDLSVRTGDVTLGVRGTSFTVTAAPDGAVVVVAKEGKVECTEDESGKKVLVAPGIAAEKSEGAALSAIKIKAGDEESFIKKWRADRFAKIRKNALPGVKKYSREYSKRVARFNAAFEGLLSEKATLDKWKRENRERKTGSTVEIMKEKKLIIKHVYKIKAELFWLERAYYRLISLAELAGEPEGEIESGVNADDFFASLRKEGIEEKLAEVKFILKLYAKRNDGSVPVGSATESDDDFFD